MLEEQTRKRKQPSDKQPPVPVPNEPLGELNLQLTLGGGLSVTQPILETSPSEPETKRSKKTYQYSTSDLQRIRATQYEFLHQLPSFFLEGKYPESVKSSGQKQTFRRKANKFVLHDGVLFRKRTHGLCRALWENEVLPTLEEFHERNAHYPKDKGKFRVLVEERYYFP